MENFSKWTLDTIRSDYNIGSWLEERRLEWVPLCQNFLRHILDGATVLIGTDSERNWYADYLISTINSMTKNRPFIPMYKLETMYPSLPTIKSQDVLDNIEDMFSISFENYIYFYIGKDNTTLLNLAKRKDNSFLWIMDYEYKDSFFLKSYDENLNYKLMDLARLLNLSIDAAIFGEIEI